MRRKIILFLIITICFLLQTTIFSCYFSFAGIVPNLLIIVVSAFGFMRGRKEGMYTGFFSGLLLDLFSGTYLGLYALLYMYIGYINGKFRKRFYPDDIRLPLLLIGSSDLVYSLLVYVFGFLLRSRFSFTYYMRTVILPELIYTILLTIPLYFILLKINIWLEEHEKRSASKFDL